MRFLPELGAAAAGALVLTFGLLLGSSIFYGNRGLFGVLIDAQGVFLGLAALVSAVQKLRGAE